MRFCFIESIRLIFCLFSSFLIVANVNSAQLSLNGIANYRVLNQDYYIAALYLPEPLKSDSHQKVFTSTQNKQMKLLINAQRWSPRFWQTQWQSDLGINNPNASKGLLEELTTFTKLLKADLVAGDLVVFDYQASIGTHIFINDQLMQSTKSMALFNALLATWVGKLPPSRDFKKRILTLSNDPVTHTNIQKLYTNTISEQRKTDILKWHYSDSQLKEMTRKKEINAQEVLALKARLKARKAARIAYQQEKTRQAKATAFQEKQLFEKQKTQAMEKQKKLAAQATLTKIRNKNQALKAKKYYKDFFHWKLYTAIRKNIQYPIWAREFNQEGTVKALFTMDYKGKVIDTQFNEEEVSNFLIAEVKEAIMEVSGKILPPKKLSGKQWQFTFNHNFSFSSKKQNPVLAPIKPRHL